MTAQIAVKSRTAARLMDLPETQFLQLVSEGVLPRPRKIGPFERWDADELRAVLRGDKIDPLEDVQW